MAFIEDMLKTAGGPSTGVVGAVGAVLVAPVVLHLIGRLVRPVLTMTLRKGIVLYRRAHHTVAELAEEARSEIADARRSEASSAAKLRARRDSAHEPKIA
ncbi:hypothetical protein ACRAWG_30840 [Methylobacterium sp. P31]